MKIKNYIDNFYYVLFGSYIILCFVMAVIIIIFNCGVNDILFGIFGLILLILLSHFFYDRYYVIKRDFIEIKCGFLNKKIKYKDIKKCYITKNNKLSYATSKKRICIETNDKKYYISPEKMDEVLLKLIQKTGGKK